jgi:hypothetical protein
MQFPPKCLNRKTSQKVLLGLSEWRSGIPRSWVRFPVRPIPHVIEGDLWQPRFPPTLHYKSPNIVYRANNVISWRSALKTIFIRKYSSRAFLWMVCHFNNLKFFLAIFVSRVMLMTEVTISCIRYIAVYTVTDPRLKRPFSQIFTENKTGRIPEYLCQGKQKIPHRSL